MELEGFTRGYVFEKDPRVKSWVSAQPSTVMLLIIGYLYMVYIWGPKFMRNRKAFQLTWTLRLYNIFQVVASFGFAVKIFYHFYYKMGNSMMCTPPDRRTDPLAMQLMDINFYYWWLRVIDFVETLFFILRNKQQQISALHVVHHVIVVTASWGSAYYGLTNLVIFILCLNSIVHAIMYSYYFLSTLGPQVQQYLWWKKHLTKVQIFQFFIMIGHLSIPMFKNCGYPSGIVYIWQAAVGIILFMFVKFYINSYKKKVQGNAACVRDQLFTTSRRCCQQQRRTVCQQQPIVF